MGAGGDFVGVVERAYALEGTHQQWLTHVLEAARPLLDRGMGVYGYCFRMDTAKAVPQVRVEFSASVGVPEHFVDRAVRLVEAVPPEMVPRTYASNRVCATASQATGLGDRLEQEPAWREFAHPMGMHDSFGVKVAGPRPTQGFMINAGLPRVEQLSPRVRRAWEQMSAHIAAGFRLREVMAGSGGDELEGAEALLDAEGGLVHGESAATGAVARWALRRAVVDMAAARGPLRRTQPEAALSLWKGLVSGRWSLIDHFEASGRRYLVARRNDPGVNDPRSLTHRERQILMFVGLGHSNKLIAYELGIGLSTVATHVARIKEKLRVTTRTELIALVHHLSSRRA